MKETDLSQAAGLGIDTAETGLTRVKASGSAGTFARNSIMNVGRLLISTAIGFLLPSFLLHRLPVTTYSAWVLILQMSAYVGYLDFGIQVGIAKYVAEYEAKHDTAGSSVRASAGLALLLIVASLGVVLTLILAVQVPHLFRAMPATLYRNVRLSLLCIGLSVSFQLLCSIFGSIFIGLQRFAVPTVLSLINRVLFIAVVLGAVFLHGSLATMGALVAVVNIATGILQFGAWRKFANHIVLSLRRLDYGVLREMIAYCSGLAVWTVAMLLISGLDVTIVGRYDFAQTGFYSIATTPTNFMIAIMGAAIAPLMPSASALSVHRTPVQMGEMLSKATRYASNLLVVSALPLLVCGYWILRVWVGPAYVEQIVGYLRILVLAHVLRNTCAPYANMLAATNSQKVAIASASAEAVVNLVSSIYLVRHIGAIGVAYGTLLGSFISVGTHFALSMHYTYAKFSIRRMQLFLSGIGRPLLIAVPTLFFVPLWWRNAAPAMGLRAWLVWSLSSVFLAWFVGLDGGERSSLVSVIRIRLRLAQATINPIDPIG